MRERPILFSGPMVRALLTGDKTQTRRGVKQQPDWLPEVGATRCTDGIFWPIGSLGQQCGAPLFKCPYGAPGDRLWVREAWHVEEMCNDIAPRDLVHDWPVAYAAGVWSDIRKGIVKIPGTASTGRLRPGIHMPRWASRLTLEVTDVRVERLQDISEADAAAEGITRIGREYQSFADPKGPWQQGPNFWSVDLGSDGSLNAPTAAGVYRMLWDHINGPDSWAANPWVWAVSFKRVPA